MLWNPGDISKLDAHWHTEFWQNCSLKCTQLAFGMNFHDMAIFLEMILKKRNKWSFLNYLIYFFSFGQTFGACKLVHVFQHQLSLFDTNNLEPKFSVDGWAGIFNSEAEASISHTLAQMKTNKFHFSNQTENKPFLGRSQTCIQLHFLAFSVWFNTTVKLSLLNQPLCCGEENVTKFLSDGGSVVKINKRGSRLHNATINHSPTRHKTKQSWL